MNEIQRRISDARSWYKVPGNRTRLVWAMVLVALFVAILPELIHMLDGASVLLLLIPVAACIALIKLMLR